MKDLQAHGGIAQALFDLLDGLVELDLQIVPREVPDSLGVHKDHLLLTGLRVTRG